MEIETTPFDGLVIINKRKYFDDRGFFVELFKESELKSKSIPYFFSQDNLSFSKKNVLRGLHFQIPPYAQAKLVTVLQGEVLDVVVDLRPSSKTFGAWFSVVLSEQNSKMMYIPEGFAHGFLVRSETCLFYYKCSSEYAKEAERGLIWNDPTIGIEWGIENPIVSSKDLDLPYFSKEKFSSFFE